MPRKRKQFTCRICPDHPTYASLGTLRSHQRSEHAERWSKDTSPALPVVTTIPLMDVVEEVTQPAATTNTINMDAMRPHLEMALLGYKTEYARLGTQITSLTALLQNGAAAPAVPTANSSTPSKPKRHISPEGKARIAAASRRRWAAAKQAAE